MTHDGQSIIAHVLRKLKPNQPKTQIDTVADPGFPVGGRGPISGGVDLRHGCILAKMYAKMKELAP